jgi:hypothetical protein
MEHGQQLRLTVLGVFEVAALKVTVTLDLLREGRNLHRGLVIADLQTHW